MNYANQDKDFEVTEFMERTIKQSPQMAEGTGLMKYNSRNMFVVENYGYVSMFFLNVKTNFTVGPVLAEDFTLFFFFKEILLKSNGKTIGIITQLYSRSRINEKSPYFFEKVNNNTWIENIINAEQNKSMPLFFSAIDGQFLDVTKYNNLTIEYTTENSHEQMGLSQDPSYINVELETIYKQRKEYVEIPLKNFYNIFQVTGPELITGTEQLKMAINCPYKVVGLYFQIMNGLAQFTEIYTVKLFYSNQESREYSLKNNYLLDENKYNDTGSVFPIILGSRKSDSKNFIKSNGLQNPLYAIITCQKSLNASRLSICAEYISDMKEDNGRLVELMPESF